MSVYRIAEEPTANTTTFADDLRRRVAACVLVSEWVRLIKAACEAAAEMGLRQYETGEINGDHRQKVLEDLAADGLKVTEVFHPPRLRVSW